MLTSYEGNNCILDWDILEFYSERKSVVTCNMKNVDIEISAHNAFLE
jgi:hypothetical protein